MSNIFVIAEAGISHDGDLAKALALIDTAREAKADAVKFQTFNAKRLSARRKHPEVADILKPYEMPLTWLDALKRHADNVGIEFMTTCFDEETLKVVAPFVRRFKIGHGEATDQKFYLAHAEYGKQIICSVTNYLEGWEKDGTDTKHLWCISAYPCPLEKADLAGIRREECDGYSDHTRNEDTGALAVAAGAKIVEVHFRLWETDKNNLDWPVSLSPTQLYTYVDLIRQATVLVYGAASEETKKLERPESAPRTSHQRPSEESGPSAYHPAVEP